MPRTLYRAYVDESGDRGMSTRASPFFVVAAVIVPGDRDADLRAARDGMCRGLDKPVDAVLHWSDNIRRHDQRKYVALALGALDFVRIAYVVVDKARLRAGASGLSDHSRMYNYAIRRLLERISWFVDACGGEAIVTFAHVRRFPYEKLTGYLDRLRATETTIRWAALRGSPRIDQQRNVRLLQLADIAAGCLDAALTPDRFGEVEPAYLARIVPLIYARPGRAVTSYGLNIVGDGAAPGSFTSRFAWWSHLFPDG